MCLIVYKPAGRTVAEASLAEGLRCNDDGAGIMYVKDGAMVIRKTLTKKAEKYLKLYRECVKDCGNGDMGIHFRKGTSGGMTLNNCHPFMLENNPHVAFCHNGIFALKGGEGESDTVAFGHVIGSLPDDFLKNDAMRMLIDMACGSYNKLLFMGDNGWHWIVNEDKGHWEEGVWYSNYTYKIYNAGSEVPASQYGFLGGDVRGNGRGGRRKSERSYVSAKENNKECWYCKAPVKGVWLCEMCEKELAYE